MIADIPGSYLTGRGGRRAVPRVKALTFTEQKKTEDVLGGLVEGKAGATGEANRNNGKRTGETGNRRGKKATRHSDQ